MCGVELVYHGACLPADSEGHLAARLCVTGPVAAAVAAAAAC